MPRHVRTQQFGSVASVNNSSLCLLRVAAVVPVRTQAPAAAQADSVLNDALNADDEVCQAAWLDYPQPVLKVTAEACGRLLQLLNAWRCSDRLVAVRGCVLGFKQAQAGCFKEGPWKLCSMQLPTFQHGACCPSLDTVVPSAACIGESGCLACGVHGPAALMGPLMC